MSLFTRSLLLQTGFILLSFSLCSLAYDNYLGPTIPFNPNAIPLAVRGPYVNAWMPQGPEPATINSFWPQLWVGSATLGWYASVKVDGTTCQILGSANIGGTIHANQTSVQLSPTRTSFLFDCGAVEVNATFLSPIDPTDLVRQSLPLSYFYMTTRSTDGAEHAVSMYSDISAEWISGDNNKIVEWNTHVDSKYMILQEQLQSPQTYVEIDQHPQDATGFHGMSASGKTSWQTSSDVSTRTAFANTSLSNAADSPNTFRAVNKSWPILGLAVDLGSITTSESEPAVWVVGVLRDPSVQYMAANGQIEHRRPYYQSVYGTTLSAVQAFIDDFPNALNRSIALDAKVIGDGLRYSSDYADLISLNLRQAMGALEITLSQNADGSWNGTDIKAFMKDMGSLNSLSGVNQVDILYAAFPVYMYLNPELGGYLLAPLLEYQDTAMYTLPYAAMNIGSSFPNATADGLNSTHPFGVDQSANMLIMALAHAQGGGNGTLISKHYTLLRRWADYLVDNSLTPQNQLTADKPDLSTYNQTNVALKGILGIAAMGRISSYAGVASDASNYTNIAKNYMNQWSQLAKSADNTHLVMNYGAQDTTGLMYNLYADKLLQLDLVPDEVYQIQTVFYNNAVSSAKFGLPLDSEDPQITRSDWVSFSAATADHADSRDAMISQIHLFAQANNTNVPFCVSYDPTSASCLSGTNSPAVGGLFSFLALNQTIKNVTIPSEGSTIPGLATSNRKSHAGAIAGGVIGALAGLALIVAGVFFLRRRRFGRHQSFEYGGEKFYGGRNSGKPPGFVDAHSFEPFAYAQSGEPSMMTIPSIPYSRSAVGSNAPLSETPDSSRYIATKDARNVRDSSYFRDGSSTVIGPSASQVGQNVMFAVANGAEDPSHMSSAPESSVPQVIIAKQSLANEELRSEVDSLRRDLERMRRERTVEEAPPLYSEPV